MFLQGISCPSNIDEAFCCVVFFFNGIAESIVV